MPQYANPYTRPNLIDTALNTAGNVIGLKDALQARKDRAEDRKIAAEDREQRRGLVGLQTEQARLTIDKTRQELEREKALREAQSEYGRALSRFTALSDPKAFSAVADFATALQTNDPKALQATYPQAIEAYGRINEAEFNTGIGEKVPGTEDVIIAKKPVDFMRHKQRGTNIPVLEVTARKPDGTTYAYQAPRTDGTTSPNAPVRELTDDELIGHIEGALETGMAIQGGQLTRQQLDDYYRAKFMELGLTPKQVEEMMRAPAPKVEKREWEEGNKKVTEFVDEYGNVTKRAEAPRFQAREPTKPTDVQEYRALVNEVGQEEADRIWSRAKPSAARNELPLSPNQVLSQARAARATAESRLKNEAANNFDLQNDPAAQAKRREELFDEELNYLAIDRDMVREAAKRTGKADPMGGDGKQSGADTAPVQVTTEAEIAALPKGAKFTFNGRTYTRN